MESVGVHDIVEEVREGGQSPQEKKSTKKGYRLGSASPQSVGMMSVAGCPIVSAAHIGVK